VFDPSDTTKFWQLSNGTTAGAFGSPIGRLDDTFSGGSRHFSQATAGKRPGAVAPGWVSFDGVDDLLARAAVGMFAGASGCSIIMAVQAAARAGSVSTLWAEESTAATNPVYQPGTRADPSLSTSDILDFERNDAGGVNLNGGTGLTVYNNAAHVLSIVTNIAIDETVHSWCDRVAGTDRTYTRSGTMTINNSSLGAFQRTSEGNWWPGKMGRAIFIARPLTSTERANAEAWCASPYGITLP
jgi:hypothetical protein